jgi:hypothetical protein
MSDEAADRSLREARWEGRACRRGMPERKDDSRSCEHAHSRTTLGSVKSIPCFRVCGVI